MTKKRESDPLARQRAVRHAAAEFATAGAHTAASLAFTLTARVGRRIDVRFGRSRTLPVQLRRTGDLYQLRLHAFFATAPEDVVAALASWIAHGRRNRPALGQLDAWIDLALDGLPARRRPPPAVQPRGNVHDLEVLALEVRAEGRLDDLEREPRISWGYTHGRARSSLQLGLYDPDADTVRIHPVLDDHSVPAWFVRSVLFHELLHAAIPPRRDAGGRWVKHGAEFRQRERDHPDYARAERWLAAHIGRLIDAARRTARARLGRPRAARSAVRG